MQTCNRIKQNTRITSSRNQYIHMLHQLLKLCGIEIIPQCHVNISALYKNHNYFSPDSGRSRQTIATTGHHRTSDMSSHSCPCNVTRYGTRTKITLQADRKSISYQFYNTILHLTFSTYRKPDCITKKEIVQHIDDLDTYWWKLVYAQE